MRTHHTSTKVLIERLNKQKDIAGRSDEVVYMKTCGIGKQDLHNRYVFEQRIRMLASLAAIEAGACPDDRKKLIEEKYWAAYEEDCKRELPHK